MLHGKPLRVKLCYFRHSHEEHSLWFYCDMHGFTVLQALRQQSRLWRTSRGLDAKSRGFDAKSSGFDAKSRVLGDG